MNNRNNIKELLKEELIIPEIQRDYVWGNNELVIKRFINNIKNMGNNEELDIGFFYSYKIYGTNALIDGQQRITTLILLSWYVGVYNEELKNFKFKVRDNSNNFLEELLKNKSNEIENNIWGEKFSDKIKNCIWYKNIWNNDPTVKSILNALDIIEEELKKDEIIEKIKEKITKIEFLCIEAGDRRLEKEYILLNSRGVNLTNSEQLKAILTEDIENNKDKWLEKWEKDWQDILWECKEKNTYNTDNIWNAVLYWVRDIYIIENKSDNEEQINYEYDLIGIEKNNKVKVLEILDWVIAVLKIINDNADEIQKKCEFEKIKIIDIKGKIHGKNNYYMEFKEKALFYSILYLIKNEYNIKEVKDIKDKDKNKYIKLNNDTLDKIRIFRNLVQNSTINASNLHKSVNSLKDFNIDKLGKLEVLNKEQKEEEAFKLEIFEKYNEYKELIMEIENNDLFKGKIKDIFILMLSYKISINDKLSIDNLYINYDNRQFFNDNKQALLDIQFDLLETLFKKYKETNENKNNIWFELLLYNKFYKHDTKFIYFSEVETRDYFEMKEKKGLITLVYLYFSFQDINNINDFQKKHQEIKLREIFNNKDLDYNYIEQLYILYTMNIVSNYKQFVLYLEEGIVDENQKLNLNNSPFINKCIFDGYKIRSSYPQAQLKFGENLEEKLKKLIQEYNK